MRSRAVITRRQILAGILAGAALVAVLTVRQLRPVPVADSAREVAVLRAEIAALPPLRPIAAPEAPASGTADWQKRLGAAWRVIERGATWQIAAVSPGALSWRELEATVHLLEEAGVSPRSLDIATRGTRHARQFSRVEFTMGRAAREIGRGSTAAPVSLNTDRRARGTTDRTAAGDRPRPATLRSAVHFAADRDQAASFPAPRARAAGPTTRGSSGWAESHDEPQPWKP